MADAGTDATTTVEFLKKAADALGGDVKTKLEAFWKTLKDSTVNVSDAAKAAGISAADLGNKIQETGGKLTLGAASANLLAEALQKVTGVAGNLPDMFDRLNKKLEAVPPHTAGRLVGIALSVEPFLNVLPQAIREVGKFDGAMANMGTNSSKAFETASPAIKKSLETLFSPLGDFGAKIAGGLTEGFGRKLASFDRGVAMERQLIGIASATGHLNDMFKDGTNKLQSMDVELSTHIHHMGAVAGATGLSVGETMKAAEMYGKTFPNALSTTISIAGKYTKQMDGLEDTLKVASYYQMDYTEVMKQQTGMFRTFNSTATATIERLSDMYRVAQDMQMPTDIISGKIIQMASAFNLLGDNTRAAINVLDGLKKAMKSSDLSPEGMVKIYESMMSGVSKLDMGKKAFISSQTGGPGGMAGGLQMERLISEGKTDEVLRKTMQSMQQQFGGPTLTLKQATDNPALAGEFVKQREYLKQVAGVAGSDDEANRILEAMQNGMLDQIQLGESQNSGQKALLTATERGNEIMAMSNTLLGSIKRQAEITALTQTANATKEVRGVIGRAEGIGHTMAGDYLKGEMEKGTNVAAKTGSVGATKRAAEIAADGGKIDIKTSEKLNQDLAHNLKKHVVNVENLTTSAVSMLGPAIKEVVEGLGTGIKSLDKVVQGSIEKVRANFANRFGGYPPATATRQSPPPATKATAPRMAGPTPSTTLGALSASIKEMKMDGEVKIIVDFQNADKLSPKALEQVADVVKQGFEKYVKHDKQREANV